MLRDVQTVRGTVIRKNNTHCLMQMDNQDLIFCEMDAFTCDWADVRKDMVANCDVIPNDHPKAKWRAIAASPTARAEQPVQAAANGGIRMQGAASTPSLSATTASQASTIRSGPLIDIESRNRLFKLLWITAGIATNVLARVFLKKFKEKYGKNWDKSCVSMIDREQLQKKMGPKGIWKIETEDPHKWDVTALAHLLTENKGLGNGLLQPRSDAYNLVNYVRTERNKIVHDMNQISSQMTEANFQRGWAEVYGFLHKLAAQVSVCTCVHHFMYTGFCDNVFISMSKRCKSAIHGATLSAWSFICLLNVLVLLLPEVFRVSVYSVCICGCVYI